MRTFKDTEGREWHVGVNVAAVRAVRDRLKTDLYALLDGGFEALGELLGDPVALCDVLYVLCRRQADERQVTDEDFGRALGGDALAGGRDALVGALIDFFPSPSAREALGKVAAKAARVTELMYDRFSRRAEGLTPEQVLAAIEKAAASSASSTSSPAASASTPAPSP